MLETSLELDLSLPFSSNPGSVTLDKLFLLYKCVNVLTLQWE